MDLTVILLFVLWWNQVTQKVPQWKHTYCLIVYEVKPTDSSVSQDVTNL